MVRFEKGLGVGMGVVLTALTALCPISYADEVDATGQGAWLGVSAQRLSDEWRERADYWADGVMIVRVAPGSPAEQVGIGPGDVLVSVGSRSLRDPYDLAKAESRMEPGHAVSLVVARHGGRMIKIFNVEPGRAPGAPQEVAAPGPKVEPAPSPTASVPEAASSVTPSGNEAPASEPQATAQPAPPEPGSPQHTAGELGVHCEGLNPDLASALGSPKGRGVLVLQVESGSAADRAGIRPGDVITKVGDKTVEELAALDPAIAAAPSPIPITTLRRGTARQIVADLEAPPPPEPGQGVVAEPAPGALQDQLVKLGEEVRQLREEVQKLRTELERLKGQ